MKKFKKEYIYKYSNKKVMTWLAQWCQIFGQTVLLKSISI